MAELARSFEQPHERTSQLHSLGLKEATIHEAVLRGFVARQSCTPLDPPSYPGTVQWGETHRAIRLLTVPLEWTPDDSKNYSRIVSPNRMVAVTVATGDGFTGVRSKKGEMKIEPRTKYPKGSETTLAVETNVTLEQLTLWPQVRSIVKEQTQAGPQRQFLWILLIATDEHEIRYELARPKGQDEQGRVVSWFERIIFDPVDIDSIPSDRRDDDDDDNEGGLDVPVERI